MESTAKTPLMNRSEGRGYGIAAGTGATSEKQGDSVSLAVNEPLVQEGEEAKWIRGSVILSEEFEQREEEVDSVVDQDYVIVSAPVYPPPPGLVLFNNFLGTAPVWYKLLIIGCLIANPIFVHAIGKFWTGWLITGEFIFTLMMSLYCYPLQPGGLLMIEAVIMRMVHTKTLYHHLEMNLPVLLLVIFMVAGIHFMREFLMHFFTKILLAVPNKLRLSFLFMISTAMFSAWLDALTVTAVLMNATYGFYSIYHRVATKESSFQTYSMPISSPTKSISSTPSTPSKFSVPLTSPAQSRPSTPSKERVINGSEKAKNTEHGHGAQVLFDDSLLSKEHMETLVGFRQFLRSVLMHALVGTAIGGTFTIVGEPQNLLIGEKAGWDFMEYFWRCLPITFVTALAGLFTLFILENTFVGKRFGYGTEMPLAVRKVLEEYSANEQLNQGYDVKAMIVVQVFVALLLIICLGNHVAAVGLIGLSVIVILTSFNGIVDEARLGEAFCEAMPFCALLVVFFSVAGMIEEQGLFQKLVDSILTFQGYGQIAWLYTLDGVLSSVSDNVFVATLYINELANSLALGTISKSEFNLLAVVVNISTNIPSIATPNGQAAFLFLYTSKLAPLVDLSYIRMLLMALPYTVILTAVSFTLTLNIKNLSLIMVDLGLLE